MNQKTLSSLITLIVISLVLCTFSISPVTASKTLTKPEFAKIKQCEKQFWWKDRKNFYKELKKNCMKQQYDHHNKRKKRFHKGKDCDKRESWNLNYWKNKKNTWENLDKKQCKSLKKYDKVPSKLSQKLLWKHFQKTSNCKCAVLDYKVTNKAGLSVCYQIVSINKTKGDFIAEITIFRSSKADKFQGKPALLGFKFGDNINVKTSGLKKSRDGFLFGKSLFNFRSKRNGDLIFVSKIFIHAKVPTKISMNKLNIDDLSPKDYKVIVLVKKTTKKVILLKLGKEAKNIPISKFTSYSPFFPYLDKNKDYDKDKITTTTQGQTSTSTDQNTSSTPANKDPNATLTPTNQDPNATLTPTDQNPTLTNQDPNATTNQDPNATTNQDPNATTNQDPNAINNNTPSASNTIEQANDQSPIPGQTINATPIGLGVFGVVVAIGAAFVGYTTYERRRYRKQFDRRQQMQQNPSLDAVPDFGRAI